MEWVNLQFADHERALSLSLHVHPQPAKGHGTRELHGHKDTERQAWIFVTTSYVGWVPCRHTGCHRSTQLAPCLPTCESRAPDHSSGPRHPSWLCPQLTMSFTHILAPVELSMPMDVMRWASSSLEAESSFEILRMRVNVQH